MIHEEIKPLSLDDQGKITELIYLSLKNNDDLHIAGLLPTKQNAVNFFNIEIIPILMNESPIFGAFKDDRLLGFSCCSLQVNEFYQLKNKIATGVITIIHPEFRRLGLGSKLRIEIGKALCSMGVYNFIFEIKHDNKASLNNAQKIANELDAKSDLISFKFKGDTNVF